MKQTLTAKTTFSLTFLLLIVTVLTACGDSIKSKTFEIEQMGITSSITLEYQGDKVLKQITNSTLPYKTLNLTKEQAEQFVGTMSQIYDEIPAITHSVDFVGDTLYEQVIVDYEQMPKEDLKKLAGLSGGTLSDSLSMKETEKLFTKAGFKEKK